MEKNVTENFDTSVAGVFNSGPMLDANIYIIDDDPDLLLVLTQVFSAQQYKVSSFLTAALALTEFDRLSKLSKQEPGVILCDLQMPEVNGLEMIDRIKLRQLGFPIIMVTAHATLETAVEALGRGAFDYITKPINILELEIVTQRAIKIGRLESAYREVHQSLTLTKTCSGMISRSPKMHQIFSLIEAVSKSKANVLITGESGTGKEMVARAIHEQSSRSLKPFIAVNCSAIPEALLESELFGHKKGSFTGASENRQGLFEEANGGTIFLDEIGDMPFSLQVKLLRVIQERQIKLVGENKQKNIDVRIISATHQDLKKGIAALKFREDLYYRLCVIPIDLPPLRDRKEDIVVLAELFLSKYNEINNTPNKRFSSFALHNLSSMKWTGNVRELENTIERAVVLSQSDVIDCESIRSEKGSEIEPRMEGMFAALPSLKELEDEYIKYVLTETKYKKGKAREILGIDRKTLYRKELKFDASANNS